MDNNTSIQLASNDEILIYQSQDGIIKIDVLFENETVWLNQNQLCTLFGKSKATISEHIKHIFDEGELDENVVVRKFRTTTPHKEKIIHTHTYLYTLTHSLLLFSHKNEMTP